MSAWLANAIEKGQQVDDWLSGQRQASLALLKQQAWPSRKTEDWKYTSVRAMEKRSGEGASAAGVAELHAIENLDAIDLHFVDGHFQGISQSLPEGLSIVDLAQPDSQAQAWAVNAFTACKPQKHLFGLVNDALADNGLIVDIAANAEIKQPLRIVNTITQDIDVQHRIVVRLGQGAKATVIEHAEGTQASYFSGFAEYFVAENAYLEHYRFCLRTGQALSIGGSHFELKSEAEINSTLVGFGSELSRLDVDVMHRGERAHAKINAVYLLDAGEKFDLHSCIEHEIGHCTTDETVRGIVGDKATATFNGRIHIHRDAQKTLAELNNKNLLLTDNATINTKPELEIYADDVRCAHGATVAELDKSALYYLTSRGVSKAQALVMLNFGFINALVDEMPNEALAQWLRPQLQQRFANMNLDPIEA
ncbi:Fe-S cluster assembly protein SufD [Planctobacterium marinum]|uniref:Fe-S cluster assembly protein SufD n=1 Tax=Planctobacterium marinum TaxID=1631968 RepID=A0AA48HYE1_9ALTE|nr:Fe-S cluster assembly protein SufD [Planctobacterium marinum]